MRNAPTIRTQDRQIGDRIDQAGLTGEARDVLPYAPEGMAVRPDTIGRCLRAIRINGQVGESATGFALIGMLGATCGALPMMLASHLLGLGNDAEALASATISIPLGLWFGSSFVRSSAVSTYNQTIARIRTRIRDMTSSCSDDESMEGLRRARALSEGDHLTPPEDIVTMMRIDAVAIALDEAIRAAGPDAKAASKARQTAENAVNAIMSTTGVIPSDDAPRKATLRLERTCASLTQGSSLALAAPSARIARVLSLAERALASHPDIEDAAGGRIDHLVRVHVPRLIALRTEALDTARSQDIEAVDRGFDAAFDGIVASIEEAMASIHDEVMDRLSIEMRFLSSRRGDVPLLSAI
jgi:hypothetical protein